MKNLIIKIMAICFLSFLSLRSTYAQNIFPTCVGCKVGIGTVTPAFSLDVIGGEINLSSLNKYQLNGNPVLWHNGIITNIYVDVGAGNSLGAFFNTFVGNN